MVMIKVHFKLEKLYNYSFKHNVYTWQWRPVTILTRYFQLLWKYILSSVWTIPSTIFIKCCYHMSRACLFSCQNLYVFDRFLRPRGRWVRRGRGRAAALTVSLTLSVSSGPVSTLFFFSWCRYFIYKMLDVLSTGLPVSVALGMLPWQTMLPADINACCWCLWLLTFKFDCRS